MTDYCLSRDEIEDCTRCYLDLTACADARDAEAADVDRLLADVATERERASDALEGQRVASAALTHAEARTRRAGRQGRAAAVVALIVGLLIGGVAL